MTNQELTQNAEKYIKKTSIAGLYVVERETFTDERGFFREVFHKDELEVVLGYKFEPVQWNHSKSNAKVLRGIHPDPWDKLVYPITGKVFIAICDIDPNSPTFKKYETFTIDDDNRHALFLKKGLGNTICVLGDEPVNYVYLVTSYWDGNLTSGARAVSLFDPDLNIPWPVKDPIVSDKDRENKTLKELFQDQYPHLFK